MGDSGGAAGTRRSTAMSLKTAIHAPRGTALRCQGWHKEAALRMLHNNLDPEVAENPDELIVYGGTGRAARDWPSFHAIVRALESLANDETLLVQSGRPVGGFRTPPQSPRVLLANSNLVGHWSNWNEFNRLEKMGLTMYGQMTAGSWIYIGSQGIVQGTYETFASLARKHFGGSLAGKLVVSGGMGGMGGAQPLAATMNGARFLGIEVDPARIQRRLETGYCDRMARTLDEALELLAGPEPLSVALAGNCADVLPEMARRGIVPDVLTDQTSAHDPLNGYVPNGIRSARSPSPSPSPATAPTCCRRWPAAASFPMSSPTRPAPTIRSMGTCPTACRSKRPACCAPAILRNISPAPRPPWACMSRPCWNSAPPAPSRSITATTSAPRPRTPAWSAPSTSPASAPRTDRKSVV